MNKALCAVTICAALIGGGPAMSQIMTKSGATIGDLRQLCQSPKPGKLETCAAYLTGAAEALAIVGSAPKGGGTAGVCDIHVTPKPLLEAFLRWAGANQDRWAQPRAIGVQAALSSAWPCGAR